MRNRRIAARDPLTAHRRRRRAAARGLHHAERLEERRVMAVAPLTELIATRSEVAAPGGRAIVVIDAAVEGGASLADSFADAAATVLVQPGDDLFASVGGALERLGDVSAIHLVSHGSTGRFSFGGTVFDEASIDRWDDGLVAWNRMAGPGADLYLWGCDVAGGDGASLIDSIHQVSGFGVAASTDLTGPARLGGDFDLEYVVGDVANPRLAAGVDVLWETTLSDHTFTSATKQAMQDAFDALNDQVAPAIRSAIAGRTGSSTVDPLSQRSISDLFGASSSISPADVESLLSLKAAAASYLAGSNPTLSGLATAINAALALKADAAGAAAGSRSISVTPLVSGNDVSLQVVLSASGASWAGVDLGTDANPTMWGSIAQSFSNDFGAIFRTTPQLQTGSRLTTGFTTRVNISDPNAPTASLDIASTSLAAGVFNFGPGIRFGILDATLGGEVSLPYSTSVSFSGGSNRAVSGWSSVGASAAALPSSPAAVIDLPVSASVGSVSVTSATSKLRISMANLAASAAPTVTGIDLGRLVWFGNLSSDDLINAVKQVGGAYEALGSTEPMAASIPFVQRKSLLDAFNFGTLFDDAIGSVIDVTVPKVLPTAASSGVAFSVAANGTTLTLVGDKRDVVAVGQSVGLIPSTPAARDAVIRTVQAVALSGGNTLVTLASAIDASTTAGQLVSTVGVRPDDLQTLADFQNYPAFAALGLQPVYDAGAGTVSLQFASSRTTPITVAPEVAFNIAPLGALTFTGGTAPTLNPTVSLGFGIEFDIGPGGPIAISLGAAPAGNFRLSGNATFTVTPIGGSATTVTVTAGSTSTNASIADLIADVNAALGGTPLRARQSELGAGLELYTPTVNASMPIGITVTAVRSQGNADLGISDGLPSSTQADITFFGRPSGVTSRIVPHGDSAKKFAESAINWSLNDLSGQATYGINTIAFADTEGSVTADFSAVLQAAGGTTDDILVNAASLLTQQFTDTASLKLTKLSRVGAAVNDISNTAEITIAVPDFAADRVEAFVTLGAVVAVPGLEDSGRGTGRLSADSAIRFTIGGDTYEVTVTQAVTANNATFQDLVSDFNVALSGAVRVVNGTPTSTMTNLSNEVAFVGSGGRVSVMHTAAGVTYPVLENLLVANLAPGGGTTGRLTTNSSLSVVRGPDTYTVTVLASATAGNTSFADLVADFNAALATAQRQSGSTTTTVDATNLLRFSAGGTVGRIQPEAMQEVANPNYAIVTLPPTADLGEIGYQAGLSVPNIASALTQASRVFDTIERDLKEFNATELPLLNQSLRDLIELDAGLAGRISAFGKLSASTPQELERALETSLGLPSTDLRITYDSVRKAYRIDFTYRASKATTIAFDVDLYTYYEQLGRVLPKGIDALTDGESKTPLSVAINATSVLSVGYDLTTGKTFLYGHDGSTNRGLTNGTSFTIGFSVNGQKLEFPAKSGLDVHDGVARLQNGSLVVTLAGPAGTPASSLFHIEPGAGQLAARDVANYRAGFSGAVTVKMPIFENFAPGTLTQASATEAQESGVFGFIQDHPASFYLAMPDLAGYLDARGRMEAAQTAITGLLSRNQPVDADGVSLTTWRERLNLAAADLGGVLFAFAPELENSRNLLGAEETLLDMVRDPSLILDKLNAIIGGVESALKGIDKIALPFGGGDSIGLGGAVSSIFGWRTGWLLDMRNRMRGSGEGIFDVMRQGVFEYLGPKYANILLKYDPISMDRSLDSMTSATRPEDIGVVFMDKKRNVLAKNVRGADAFEIVFRLGQKVYDTGIDLGFQLDALESIGIGAAFDGGLRLQVGWEMLLGFGYSLTDGFYLKVDSTGDASSTGNFSGSSGQFEAQLRFDATLTGASKHYTQRWDASGGYWKIVDTMDTAVTTDDRDVIDATTGQPYRAIAVNKFAADVTGFVPTNPAVFDPCGCGHPPSATTLNEPVWWVVGTRTGNGDYVPAELNDQGRYVPQASPYAHTLIEVTAMAPAQLSGSLFFLRLAATDKIRRGLSGFTDVDSQYYYDGSQGPQTTAAQRDDVETGVNRNNELPTRFTAAVGLNMVDPSASAGKNSTRVDASAPAPDMRRVVDAKGQDVPGDSGAIAKPGLAHLVPGFWKESDIPGVYAKEYYDLKLKVAPPAKYEALDIPVRVATGANVGLSGMGIIDGVQVKVGDRVLVKNQAIPQQNGVYTVSPGAWSRSFDANDNLDFAGKPMFVLVAEGRSNKDTGWNLIDTTGTVTLGTTPLIFERTMVSVREALPVIGVDIGRLRPYVPYVTLPLLAKWVDQPLTRDIDINIEYDFVNYLVKLRREDGILSGPAIRAAQLTQALGNAIMGEVGLPNALTGAGQSYNLAQPGFRFQLAASAKPKWYQVEFARLKESDGVVSRKVERTGTFVSYGTPATLTGISGDDGWEPIRDINADASPGRITFTELRLAGAKNIFTVDAHADAVANLTMELSVGDTASSPNLVIPRIYADFNLDCSTRAARAKIDKAKQAAVDLQTNPGILTSGSGSGDEPDVSLVKRVQEEEGTTQTSSQAPGGDKGIDPASPLVKEMDLRPEIGFSNIRLDVGSFLTKFLKPTVDKAEPYLAQIRPILTFLNSPVPVLSDIAGTSIRVVDLLEKFGGPKAQGIRGVIDTVTAIDNLVAQIAALPAGVNVQIPMGRFWLPKVADPDKGDYKYGSLQYDNVALGINTNNYTQADRDAEASLQALAAMNPDSSTQKNRQSAYTSNNAQDRGGIRVPIIDDPLTLFNLMMGKTATLVTYQLPKLNYSFEKTIPLVRIVCFEVGLRAAFEMNSNLAFGFDTYGINQYRVSGDAVDIAQGFYVSDRANADGTGADVPEFQAIVSFGLYGGVDLVAVKAGVEGGVRVVGEVNLNDPNNDGKLRLTEAIGLVVDTGNPLDLFDLSLRGEAYARYYYDVGFGLIKGGKDFARITLFNLVHQGSDGTPLYGSVVDGSEGVEQLPGTLLLHVGEAAPKRVSNQDPLKAKDGAESYVIWNDSVGSGTVHVKYINYSGSRVRTYSGVQRVLFEGGIGDDSLDASGLNGLPVTFKGGDGNDTLILGSGHATTESRLEGEDGNDTITVVGAGLIHLLGGVGNDSLTGGTGIVRIEAGEGNDSITTRAGSTSTIVMAEDYGLDTAALAATALQNLLDFTQVASAIEFLLDGILAASADGKATAGEKNVLTFNVGGATEIRGSTQADSFTARNLRTRNASRAGSNMNGLLLRGGQGDDLYDFTLDSVANVAGDGIVIDDVQAITPAVAGTVTRCGTCNEIESIAVASAGAGYQLPPQVMIVDPTGSGAQAVAVLDELGRVVSIQVIDGGKGYTDPRVTFVAPRSLGDKLVITRNVPGTASLDDQTSFAGQRTIYEYSIAGTGRGPVVRFVGWGDAARPVGLDQSEIDSVTVNMPEGVLDLMARVNLFQTLTVNASRMVQNARIVADTVAITTDHGFQVQHPIHAVNSGDVKLRVTGDGTNTGEGDLNAAANRATASAVVSAGGVASLTLANAGDNYFFTPSITVGADGVTPGTGARFAATLAGNGGGLSGFTRLAPGSGYYASPAPVVVVPPPASIQIDALITSSLPNGYTSFGAGNGRGRVLLFADTGAVTTSGEVFFPTDTRLGTPQGSRTIDWIDGDFRYRGMVGLDDIVSPVTYPGVSVGIGAEFTALLDADGRVTGFTRVSGGSGYSAELPPLIEIEGLATAVVDAYAQDGSIQGLRVTYPGDGYGQPPRVTIKPNGFGRIVNSPNGVGSGLSADGVTPMNRVHIRALGGTLVAVAGAGVGDPLKPIKSDVEKFVAQVTTAGGVHILEKDGIRIGKDQSVSGITTVNGDVSITTFGGALELGAPRQALDEEGRPLWQDAAKTIPIYDRDPATGRIIYEGGDIAVGSGDVKLTADDIEVNVDLNASGGSGTITLQPVRMNAEIGLAGTRARIEGVITNGRLTGFDATKFWGGRGYTTAPLVIVDPAGQRAYASAVITAGAVTAIDVIYGGTNYDPDNPPIVTFSGGGVAGSPSNIAGAVAIVGEDGVITGFTITNAGSGYVTAPTVSLPSPGQALVQAVLDTAHPDPVTGRFAVKEFVVTNAGKNYAKAPFIEVAAPYDFTLDSDEVDKFARSFAQVVIGRIEGQHLIHSPEAAFNGAVVLRAPRAGGTLDVASFQTSGPVSIVGSGNTFHFDGANPILTGSSISIDDNVIVHAGVDGSATATTGEIVIFGTGKGMIDGEPTGTDVGDDEDLTLAAQTTVTVTGAIGSRWKLDDLTVTSATRGAVVLDRSVSLTGTLDVTGGAVTIGGVVDVAGDLMIDASSMVAFGSNVSVGGDLVITGATGVTFGGTLSVGGTLSIVGVNGTVRFQGRVTAAADLSVTAATGIEFLGGLAASRDVTLTANEVELRGGMASVVGPATGTLVVKPFTASRPIRVGTPTGTTTGSLDISDTDLAAIAPGWAAVVIGDVAAGTGAVTIGSIGAQQGSRNSWIRNATTIVGGSVTVAQKVDVAGTASYLKFVGRTGGVTINAAVNQTAAERNAWLRLEAAQGIAINAPIWSTQTVSLVSGTTTAQSAVAPITTSGLRVSAGGAVSLGAVGNAFDTLAVATTNDDVLVRELSGYAIGTVDGVSGITVGTATATLVSSGTVTQTQPIAAGKLDLQGAGGIWTLTGANTIGTLSADTGSLTVVDAAQLTVGTLLASRQVGTVIDLYAPGGLTLTGPITSAGGFVQLNNAVTLAADVVIDVVDAGLVARVDIMAGVDGTTSGQQSLTVIGHLYAAGAIGAGTALESLSVSGDTALAAGSTVRTTGDQTFSGEASSGGALTVQAGAGSTVRFLGDVVLGGLITSTADTAAYDVRLTGSTVAITSAVTFANTGSVTLGDAATDDLHFVGGLTSTAPSATNLAGTIRTTNAAATFGRTSPNAGIVLAADTTVSTGTGRATFAGTVNGASRLVVNATGDTTFAAAVGGTTPLASLLTTGGGTTAINGGSIRTTAAAGQVYDDAFELGATTVIDAASGAITFGSTVDGLFPLTANSSGMTTFGDDVGSVAALVSLMTDSLGTTTLAGGSLRTSGLGGQVFNDTVVLGANTILNAAAGAISFAKTIDGPFLLSANTTGATTFNAPVGGVVPLASLATNAGGTSQVFGGLVRTTGNQAWRDDVVNLWADTFFRSDSGAIVAGTGTVFQAASRDVSFIAATGVGSSTTPLAPPAAPIRIAAAEVTAQVTGSGDIAIVGVGDLAIGAAGLSAPGAIAIDASARIRVPDGGRIVAGRGVTAGKPVRWSVLGTADTGSGSLRQVMSNANVAAVDGVLEFTGTSNVFRPASDLPRVTTRLTIDGTVAGVVIDGAAAPGNGLVFGSGSAGSTLRAVTLRSFAGAGVVLDGSAGTLVQGVVIQASGTGLRATGGLAGSRVAGSTFTGNTGFGVVLDGATGLVFDGNTVTSLNTLSSMGLYATGDLAGTSVVSSVFRGGLRGALLDNARNLAFGEIGRGNRLIGSASVRGSDFAGTGIRVQGNLAGTTIKSNVITGNNYGMAFVNARGVVFGGRRPVEANRINASRITGILVVGDNTGSANIGTVFGTGANANKVNITRARGSRGV